jgi:IclR family transcriptional regulator, KDG regulon repressor
MNAAASLKTASPPAVDRAFAILEEVARSSRGLRLPEMTRRLGLPKSSTHSLLVALERRRYLQRNAATGRYQFGPGIFTLANAGLKGMGLRELSYPILAALWRRTGLNVQMAIMDGDHAVLIEQIAGMGESVQRFWLGERLELHCTALGKTLAAFEPEAQWMRFAQGNGGLRRHNDNTICSSRKFLDDLATTRKRGYALDDEEMGLGVRCLGVPVFGPAGRVVAAISVSGSCLAVHADNAATLVKLLENAAAQIGKAVVRSATNGAAGTEAGDYEAAD